MDGRARFSRRFGWPTVLDPRERVWLVGRSVSGPATIRLNETAIDTSVSSGGVFSADISTLLQSRNKLVIDTPIDGALGDVALEVRPADSAPA